MEMSEERQARAETPQLDEDASLVNEEEVKPEPNDAARITNEDDMNPELNEDAHITNEDDTAEPTRNNEPVIPWQPPPPVIHPQAAEIVRQVDFYFSEENLRQDAHLLGLIQAGDGLVSLNEMLSWRKMRKYKPMSAVREALKQSTVVEVIGTKRLRRREPLQGPVFVTPRVDPKRQAAVVPAEKPWLTKGMLKPTGFEEGVTNGPIRPEEYEEDRDAYDPAENSFPSRIERAIMKFCANRKMHSDVRKVWVRFLRFGGIEATQRQFTGGLGDSSMMEDYSKKEIAELNSGYEVSEMVMAGIYEEGDDGEVTWVVDFEAVAKAFLSGYLMDTVDWYNDERVATATGMLRSFYNYLLYHDVCPEYAQQIHAARKVAEMAGPALRELKEVDRNLPGDFNIACSTLYSGTFAGLHAKDGEWVQEKDKIGLSDEDAWLIFSTGIAAYGTEEQLQKLQKAAETKTKFNITSSDNAGLEVVAVLPAEGEAKAVYSDPRFTNTVVKPMGRLQCKRWDVPNAAPRDLPKWLKEAAKTEVFEFIVNDTILEHCSPGMKMEVQIKELDIGIQWIDSIETTYPSYFIWLANDEIRHYKPGGGSKWMQQQNAKKQDGVDGANNNETEVQQK